MTDSSTGPPSGPPPPYPVDAPPPWPSRTFYFAYGSDMQVSYMARTCPGSRYIGRAVLTDYKWHINGLGFANLTKVKTAHAPGLVFEVDDADKASLEEKRFPLYKSVTVDAELYPAPFCLYRRQSTWITKHGGPEAVLEEAFATGRGNDRRASYTERGILVFLSVAVTVDGRPDARYAESINAAAADAMALGIDAVFFEKIVQQFMPGRMLPYLRVVRRGKSVSPEPSSRTAVEARVKATGAAVTSVAERMQAKRNAELASAAAAIPSVVVDSTEVVEKAPAGGSGSGSGFGGTIRTIFQRHSRRKESGESSTAGGRRSPLLTGSESGNETSSNSNNGNNSDDQGGGGGGGGGYKSYESVNPWATKSGSGSGSAVNNINNRRHSKSQSESNLVEPPPMMPVITISRPSSAAENKKNKDNESDDNDNGEGINGTKTATATTVTATMAPKVRRFEPPFRPKRPPPPAVIAIKNYTTTSTHTVPVNAVTKKTDGASVSTVDQGITDKEQSAVITFGTVRRDTSGWDKVEESNRSSGSGGAGASPVERKPVMRKRVTMEQAVRTLGGNKVSVGLMAAAVGVKAGAALSTANKAAPPPRPKRGALVAAVVVPSVSSAPPAAFVRPLPPRQPFMPRRAARRACQQPTPAKELRRPKSFCGARQLSRFDQFLLQAAEHPHFREKPWLPAFNARGQGHFQHQVHAQRHRVLFTQTVVTAQFQRERRMSF